MESISESFRERLYRADAFDKVVKPLPFNIVLKFIVVALIGLIFSMFMNSEIGLFFQLFFLCVVVISFMIYLIFYSKIGIHELNKIKKEFYKLPEEEKKRYNVTEVSIGDILIDWPVLNDYWNKAWDEALAVFGAEVVKVMNTPCDKCFFRFDYSTREGELMDVADGFKFGSYGQQVLTGCALGIAPSVVGESLFCSDIVKREGSIKKFKEKFNTEDLLGSLNGLKDEIVSVVDKNEKKVDDEKADDEEII